MISNHYELAFHCFSVPHTTQLSILMYSIAGWLSRARSFGFTSGVDHGDVNVTSDLQSVDSAGMVGGCLDGPCELRVSVGNKIL